MMKTVIVNILSVCSNNTPIFRSVGVVTQIEPQTLHINIHVSFLGTGRLIHAVISPKTSYFRINGMNASRRQYPLQNCFALTVHKSQGLTLPHVSLFFDKSCTMHIQMIK